MRQMSLLRWLFQSVRASARVTDSQTRKARRFSLRIEELERRDVLDGLSGPYTDPAYFTQLPFGDHSHWIQPYRSYLETMPASTFLNGTGVNLNDPALDPDLIVEMLASHGIHHARIEISWGNLNYATEELSNPAHFQAALEACARWGVRPLILLNAHSGVPGPALLFNRTVTANAPAGATQVELNTTSGLVLDRSGLSNLTEYWAAEALVTAINGNTVTLSKPLPRAISAGASVPMATLKYRPFSVPGSADYNETITGWQHYVDTIAAFVTDTLGTSQNNERGFDMEVWNELTFGSRFLYINSYYDPPLYSYDQNSIWHNLIQATADHVDDQAPAFQGVQFGDGFANTIPWPASSTEPARFAAVDKHPYAGLKNFPANEQNGPGLNALGQVDSYVPTYSAVFPEYFGTATQTETLVRDMGPITNSIYGTLHGRYARPDNPTSTWITEVGIAPNEIGINDPAIALALKGKTTARYFTFFLNKGVGQLDLYAATVGDTWLGVVQDNFVDYAKTHTEYPDDDVPYTSPALAVTGRMADQMRYQLDPDLTETRPLQIDAVEDTHNHSQFAGDGTAAHPDLYDRELFTFLPFQVNAHRLVIPYYVMTRRVDQGLAPEDFTVQVSGVNGVGASVTAYDPVNDTAVPVQVNGATATSLNLTLPTTDYPYLLIIQETPFPYAPVEKHVLPVAVLGGAHAFETGGGNPCASFSSGPQPREDAARIVAWLRNTDEKGGVRNHSTSAADATPALRARSPGKNAAFPRRPGEDMVISGVDLEEMGPTVIGDLS